MNSEDLDKEMSRGSRLKTLHNSDVSGAKTNVPDLQTYGHDLWKLLCKASSIRENWMKSTKVMQIDYVGCVVQVTTQQGERVAEALTFIPGVHINADGSCLVAF